MTVAQALSIPWLASLEEALRQSRGTGKPEAQYWLGVTRYRAEGKPGGLKAEWNVLLERWPESRWARSASFIRLQE